MRQAFRRIETDHVKHNQNDNAKVVSFTKTLRVETVSRIGNAIFEDVAVNLPRLIEGCQTAPPLHLTLSYLSPRQLGERHTRPSGQNCSLSLAALRDAPPITTSYAARMTSSKVRTSLAPSLADKDEAIAWPNAS